MTTEIVATIESLHPQQRHALETYPSRKPEFIGSIEDMDVFWMLDPPSIIVKFGSRPGDCYWRRVQARNAHWKSGHNVSRKLPPTAEQLELALTMCKCFAQNGRLPEWDEEVTT